MAHKIKKTDLLIEIRGKGAICRTYQEENPDKLAQQRVSKLDNNPCGDGKYYVKSDGAMAISEWVDQEQYYVDSNGCWVPGKQKISLKIQNQF